MITSNWGRGNRTCTHKGIKASLGDDENVLKVDNDDGCTQSYDFFKTTDKGVKYLRITFHLGIA